MIGNDFTVAITTHFHTYGHNEAFPPPSPDGNPFACIYLLLTDKNNETNNITANIRLAPLQNIEDKLKLLVEAHVSLHHWIIASLEMLIPTKVTTTIGGDCSPP